MAVNVDRQHVLTKKEKSVMRVVYKAAEKNNGVCLLSLVDIFEELSLDIECDDMEIDEILRNLELDEYFDLTRSDRKGELVYCINMKQKGLAFARVERAFKSNLVFKILFALGVSCLTALVSVGLKYLFSEVILK